MQDEKKIVVGSSEGKIIYVDFEGNILEWVTLLPGIDICGIDLSEAIIDELTDQNTLSQNGCII